MTQWHLINNDGNIVKTVTASSRADAVALLGRGGTVVSALSWKHDVHRWRPVKTVVTDIIQPQKAKSYQMFEDIKTGWLGVSDMVKKLDAREGVLRRIIDKYGIPFEIVSHKGRRMRVFSPASVARIKKHVNNQPDRSQPRSVVEKRRVAFVERMRHRYLARSTSRTEKAQ